MAIAELDQRLLLPSEMSVRPVIESNQGRPLAELESNWLIKEFKSQAIAFLSENPPTVGHGFSHLVKTARNAYFLAIKNNYGPVAGFDAYVSGLFHDIYRPAWSRDGKEDHEALSAAIAQEVLSSWLDDWRVQRIVNTIDSRDEHIIAGRASFLDELVSIADKADMNFQRAMAYLWACNRVSGDSGVSKVESAKAVLGFFLYRQQAYQVFEKVSIWGTEFGERAYNKTSRVTNIAVWWTLMGHYRFNEKLLQRAKREAFCEVKYLKEAGATPSQIEQISANFPLLDFYDGNKT